MRASDTIRCAMRTPYGLRDGCGMRSIVGGMSNMLAQRLKTLFERSGISKPVRLSDRAPERSPSPQPIRLRAFRVAGHGAPHGRLSMGIFRAIRLGLGLGALVVAISIFTLAGQ